MKCDNELKWSCSKDFPVSLGLFVEHLKVVLCQEGPKTKRNYSSWNASLNICERNCKSTSNLINSY